MLCALISLLVAHVPASQVSPQTASAQRSLLSALIGVSAAYDEHSFDSLRWTATTLLNLLDW